MMDKSLEEIVDLLREFRDVLYNRLNDNYTVQGLKEKIAKIDYAIYYAENVLPDMMEG